MLRALAEVGVRDFQILPPTGHGHPILTFDNGLTKVRIPLPCTPTGGSTLYVPRVIRQSMRRARNALAERSETATGGRTVRDHRIDGATPHTLAMEVDHG